MEKIIIYFQNCYGIRKMQHEFDLSKGRAFVIYAPNGVMKTSFAQVFDDVSRGNQPKDRAFPYRETVYSIQNENGSDINPENILVVKPYDKDYSSKKTASLMVNEELRREYEDQVSEIEEKADNLLKALSAQANKKTGFQDELIATFGNEVEFDLYEILARLGAIINKESSYGFSEIIYQEIFNPKVLKFLEKPKVRRQIGEYVRRYNELLDKSPYFRRGVFNHTNASSVQKALNDNGFFSARHKISLADRENHHRDIITSQELDEAIEDQKKEILQDPGLLSRFDNIDKEITRNAELRKFRECLETHPEIIPELADLNSFRRKLWISYANEISDLFLDFAETFQEAKSRISKIVEMARSQETHWQNIVKIFHDRFFVPFKLEVKNTADVILQDETPNLIFHFCDSQDKCKIKRNDLLNVLSRGELRALYLLNMIFEIQAQSKETEKTILIIDDVADSFDYKNKYAIIQYLKDILDDENFVMIILTHNFDFFRTVQSRLGIHRKSNCLMAVRDEEGQIILQRAQYLKPFSHWRKNLNANRRIMLALIPMVRNLVEYMLGTDEDDEKYNFLTSLLHIKPETENITMKDLASVINPILKTSAQGGAEKFFDVLLEEADKCTMDHDQIKLENKIILSIAIRLIAEGYMIETIDDISVTNNIQSNQTQVLYAEFKKINPPNNELKLMEQVLLMTPESIHLNSFMYEPILDMSHVSLCKLYQQLKSLKHSQGTPSEVISEPVEILEH